VYKVLKQYPPLIFQVSSITFKDSKTMFRPIGLNHNKKNTIYLHSMPCRFESRADTFRALEDKGIDYIICLTGDDEIREKSPLYWEAIEGGILPAERLSYPIEDFGAPEDGPDFLSFLETTAGYSKTGKSLLVHCAYGMGRTGLFAVCLLLALGFELKDAMALVLEAGSDPETPEQREFVNWVSEQFSAKH
jgi:protein-tyrosine phosphatase